MSTAGSRLIPTNRSVSIPWRRRLAAWGGREKKSLRAREQNPVQREAFRAQIATQPAADFVVVDECGSNLNLTPLYGRAPRGERACGVVPRNTPANTTLIASLTVQGIGPSLMMPGATDGIAFETYVRQVLAPVLRPGQIVLMDNLSVHHRPIIRELIEAWGCQVWFLPSYSPDLSPIEQAFAKLKAILRRIGARTLDALYTAIEAALSAISPADALAFFRDCGYHAS